MSYLSNFTPHWCATEGVDDFDWGCGWRSLQTIMTQLGIVKDIWTLAFEVKEFTQDPELIIDFDTMTVSMADMSLLAPYFVDQAEKMEWPKKELNLICS